MEWDPTVLEKKDAVVMLLAVYKFPGNPKNFYVNNFGYHRIRTDRLNDLIGSGLVSEVDGKLNNSILLNPTATGSKVAEAIIAAFPDFVLEESNDQ